MPPSKKAGKKNKPTIVKAASKVVHKSKQYKEAVKAVKNLPIQEKPGIASDKNDVSPKQDDSFKILEKPDIVKGVESVVPEMLDPLVVKGTKPDDSAKDELHDERNRVEALLFACGKYMDEGAISDLCGVEKKKVAKLLVELKDEYHSRNGALGLFQEDRSWKINVRERYVSLVRKIVADTELPRSTMETLAVIAWKTPVYQSDIVRIRGNKCYDHIEELQVQGFITKERKGRSYILKTTDKFYNYFDIDKKNMASVLEAVKVPEAKPEQTKLELPTIPEDETDKVQAIELRKRTESDEEKAQHHAFLNEMEQKIIEVAKKNAELDVEFPMHRHSGLPSFDVEPEKTEEQAPDTATSIQDEDTITLNGEHPEEELVIDTTQKPKHLTKKQLEKKFRDDLVRVREKMEKK